ncbi:MAG: protein kinase [Acidobacteriota bacterium]
MQLRAGERLGSYEIIGPLSSGGMGQLYRARDARLNRVVAIKLLAPDLAGDREALIRLRREAETASQLNHPNLVTIFDIGEASGGQFFVAMELIDGMSLRQWLSTKPPPAEIAEILSQVAEGLGAAHASGVVHRDVKPDNVMVTDHGFAKVIDFGLAKGGLDAPTSDDSPTSFLTQQGRIVGTVVYMSPEQLRGEPLDGACDVFALGSVLHEALAGKPPFDTGAPVQTIARILNEAPVPLPANADPRLAALSTSMLAKDPASRPKMQTVAAELRAFARGSDASPVAATSSRRPRWFFPMIVVAVISATIAAAWLMRPRDRSTAGSVLVKPAAEAPSDPKIREVWTRAQFFADDKNGSAQDKSIPLLEEVVRRDPEFLPARTTLALQYCRRAFDRDPDRSWEQKAFLQADEVMRRDPASPVAHGVLAQLKWTKARGFAHEDAMIEISKALAADPAYEPALSSRASILMHVGMFPEALADYEHLLRINPADFDLWMRIARIHLWQGDTARALRELREYGPENWQIALALNELGRREEALKFTEQRLGKNQGDFWSVYALILASMGRRSEAKQAIARVYELGEGSSHFHHALYNVASAWAQMGEGGKAVEVLDRISREGMPCYPLFQRDPMLDPIRADPRFRQFLSDSREAFETRRRTLKKYLPLGQTVTNGEK